MNMYGNCAQASFSTLQEKFGIECDTPSIVRAPGPFPGIALSFETCGAVSGCLIALGLVYGTGDLNDQEKIWRCMRIAKEFYLKVVKELGSSRCGEIMERQFGKRFDFHDPAQSQEYGEAGGVQKCTTVVQTSVKIAYELMRERPKHDMD